MAVNANTVDVNKNGREKW